MSNGYKWITIKCKGDELEYYLNKYDEKGWTVYKLVWTGYNYRVVFRKPR